MARHPVLIEGQPVKVRVAVRCKVGEWGGADTSSGMFLGYGYFELFPKGADWAHKAAERGWIELQLWVKEPWQVERWDTDGTTTPRPKRPTRLAPPNLGPALHPNPAPKARRRRSLPGPPLSRRGQAARPYEHPSAAPHRAGRARVP
ncbi:hypothetical protein ACIPXV_27060 [Streptomyces libani]|uniref:hypothetical protein n=1 Tax=Streptomyces nigrescens TaxID=1920 RepID=UPI00380232BC